MIYMTRPVVASRILAFLLVLALPNLATPQNCTLKNNYCVPFTGCVIETGELIIGQTYGRREGPIRAVTSNGATCSGHWKRTFIGTGRAQFTCDDARSGKGSFTYFDKKTGTARGRESLSNGHKVGFWAGSRILQYVLTKPKEMDAFGSCLETYSAWPKN